MSGGFAPMSLQAQAKINLCLLLGPVRSDGYHELVSVILPLDLADEVAIEPAGGEGPDLVVCEGVEGPNLATKALAQWREASGWDGPPVRLTIGKRIPVAAGMGGGSADAAAALRLVAAAAGRAEDGLLAQIAPRLGADVPALLRGGPLLAEGLGERLTPLPAPAPAGYLIVPSAGGLSTPEVFAAAGELGLRRDADELAAASADLRRASRSGEGWQLPGRLVDLNDLQTAAIALAPSIMDAIAAVREAGAPRAFVTGSGPTVIGVFDGPDGHARASEAASLLDGLLPAPIVCSPSTGSATIVKQA